MVYIVKLHHDTETLLSSKTVPKLRGGLAIILLVVIMTAAQGQVISQQNAFHSNDCLTLLQISCPTLDHCGIDAVWDVSNMSVIDDSYSVEYLLASEDSEDIIACYEQATRHIYDQKGDSILINGFENRLTRLDYDIREPYLRFPMQYGDSLEGYYHGTGMYCDRLALRSYGRYKTKADGIGELILPDGDTLRNVIRLHTERLVAVEDYPAYMLDRLQAYTEDSIAARLTDASSLIRLDIYRWYAAGYRYPILEVRQRCDMASSSATSLTAYYCPPKEQAQNNKVPSNEADFTRGANATPDTPFSPADGCTQETTETNLYTVSGYRLTDNHPRTGGVYLQEQQTGGKRVTKKVKMHK